MKLPQGSDAKANRKILKPQVERRRRERMNRSLESLKTLLLLQPQEEAPRRVEKAEILEHTVSFLQKNTATGVHAGGGVGGGGGGGGGVGGGSFHDGFSSCLRRAVEFLGPEEKRLRLGAALDASLSARLARAQVPSVGSVGSVGSVERRTGAPPLTHSSRSFLWKLVHSRAAHRLHTAAHSAPRCAPTAPLQSHAAASRGGKQSAPPVGQALWRPWP